MVKVLRPCATCAGPRVARQGGRGLCAGCYQRAKRSGQLTARPRLSVQERVDRDLIRMPNDCMIWTGPQNGRGYGTVTVGGRNVLVHRFQYERHVGPIPAGLVVDHRCCERICANPSHLEAVTPRENTLRSPFTVAGRHARTTHCPQGHAYTPENTYLLRNGTNRQCKTCCLDRARLRAVSA